jgi:hypothetical protein
MSGASTKRIGLRQKFDNVSAGTQLMTGVASVQRGAVMMRIYSIAFLLTGLACVPAHAGTCRICGDGGYTVESCEDGSVQTWDSRHRGPQVPRQTQAGKAT